MTPKPWHTGELQIIRLYAGLGGEAIGVLLERSTGSVESKARELGISLKIDNEDIDVSRLTDRLLTRLHEIPGLQICPLCGKRVATMKHTGMCRPCHLDQLIELRETQLSEEIRLRKLTKLRQDRRRLRVCSTCGQAFFPRPSSSAQTCQDCGGEE